MIDRVDHRRYCNPQSGRHGVTAMVEIKDTGSEFHWSRPRIVALLFAAGASPIFYVSAAVGHSTMGGIAWFTACIGLTIGYVRPTRLRSFMQRLIPTSVEKAERARKG
jgi:predicted lysophospholipase L1 biosynthesis ABC-type transport system permease subunit